MRVGGKPVLRYQADKIPPRPDITAEFHRGGYLHPLFTPSGVLVTDDYPKDHKHHHGIWTAWTSTEYEGRKPDFWNMGGKKARKDHVSTGDVAARIGRRPVHHPAVLDRPRRESAQAGVEGSLEGHGLPHPRQGAPLLPVRPGMDRRDRRQRPAGAAAVPLRRPGRARAHRLVRQGPGVFPDLRGQGSNQRRGHHRPLGAHGRQDRRDPGGDRRAGPPGQLPGAAAGAHPPRRAVRLLLAAQGRQDEPRAGQALHRRATVSWWPTAPPTRRCSIGCGTTTPTRRSLDLK